MPILAVADQSDWLRDRAAVGLFRVADSEISRTILIPDDAKFHPQCTVDFGLNAIH